MQPKNGAVLELLIGTALWGFSFIAVVWSLESLTPGWITAYRFLLCLPVFLGAKFFFKAPNTAPTLPAMLAGALLVGNIWTQAAGLKTITAGESGFLTALYVVFIPLIEFLVFRTRLRPFALLALLPALLGCVFMVEFRFTAMSMGALLTILSALLAAAHVVLIGYFAPRMQSPVDFHFKQTLSAGILSTLLALISEPPIPLTNISLLAAYGLIFLAIGPSFLAHLFLIRAQRFLTAFTVGVLCLLESPLAAAFGVWLLSQTMSSLQVIGSLLIVLASLIVMSENVWRRKRLVSQA